MVKTWFEQIPNISKNKPKPPLKKRSKSRCSKWAPRTNSNKNEAWKTFMFSSPGEAQPYEHTKDFTKTPVYVCFMGNYTDWGWGEIFSQQLTPNGKRQVWVHMHPGARGDQEGYVGGSHWRSVFRPFMPRPLSCLNYLEVLGCKQCVWAHFCKN